MNQEEVSKLDLENMPNEELQELTLKEIALLSYEQIKSLSLEKRKNGFDIGQRNALLKRESDLLKELNIPASKSLVEESPFKLSSQFEKALNELPTPTAGEYVQGIEKLQQLASEQLESRKQYYEFQQAVWSNPEEAERRIISDLNRPLKGQVTPSEQSDLDIDVSQLDVSQLIEAIEKAEEDLEEYTQSLEHINADPSVSDGTITRKGTLQSESDQSTKIGSQAPSISEAVENESIADDDAISVTESMISAASRTTSDSGSGDSSITTYSSSYEDDYKKEKLSAHHEHGGHDEKLEERSPQQFVELATGVGIAAGYTAQVLKAGPEGLVKGLEKKAELLQKDQMAWLGEVGKAQGIGDAVISTATMGLAAPLAIKTIMSGWKEYKHSKHTIEHLEEKIPKLEKALQDLEQASHLLPENAVKAARVIAETQLKEMQFFLKEAKTNKKTGMAEVLGGSAVIAKTTLLATAKVGTLIASKVGASAATMGGLTTFATAVGIANTVIGPVAGGIAVYVGAKSYKTNKEKLEYLNEVRPETSSFLENAADKDPMLKHYQTAIETKLDHREKFYKSGKIWNANLMAGGALFGAATTAGGAASIALAALGVGALAANPVGAGVVTAAVSVGAVYMGASAVHNYINAPKQELYNKAMEGNAPGIDKDFLASLDSLAMTAPDKIDPLMGVTTRAALNDSFAKCNDLVQDILLHNGTGKDFKGVHFHSTDTDEVIQRRTTQLEKLGKSTNPNTNYWLRERQATWSAGSTLGRIQKPLVTVANLHRGKEIASRMGKEAYAERASYLTKTEYAKKLQDPNTNHSELYGKLEKILKEQAKGVAVEIESAKKALPVSLDLFSKELRKKLEETLKEPQTPEEMQANIKLANEIYKTAIKVGDKRLEDLMMKHVDLMKLSETFKAFSSGAVIPTDEQKAHAIEEYMARRQDQPHIRSSKPDVKESFEKLASFLIETEPQIYRLQKATMPFVETYTASMRTAMKQSLALDNAANVAVHYEPESVEALIPKMKHSYEFFTEKNLGHDEKKIKAFLKPIVEEFIQMNTKLSQKNEPPVSIDTYVNKRFEDRIKKVSGNKKDEVDKPLQEIKKLKKGFSH